MRRFYLRVMFLLMGEVISLMKVVELTGLFFWMKSY